MEKRKKKYTEKRGREDVCASIIEHLAGCMYIYVKRNNGNARSFTIPYTGQMDNKKQTRKEETRIEKKKGPGLLPYALRQQHRERGEKEGKESHNKKVPANDNDDSLYAKVNQNADA